MEWPTPFFRGLADCVPVPSGPFGNLCHGEPEGLLVELVGCRRLGGEPDHLVPAGLEGPTAVGVFAGENAGLLVTEG